MIHAVPFSFGITGGAIDSVVQGGILPIWKAPPDGTDVAFDVSKLLSANGLALAGGQPFTFAGFSFNLTNLGFANPGGGSTADAQVLMQGTFTLPQLHGLDFSTAQLAVNGGNYLIAEARTPQNPEGFDLTGATFAAANNDMNLASMDASGADLTVTYSNNAGHHDFTIGGGVHLGTKEQRPNNKRALNNLGATLNFTLRDGDLTALGFAVSGGFQLFGSLDVATDAGNPLSFQYDLGNQRFEIEGGLTVQFAGNSGDVNRGFANNPNDPGIVIQDGHFRLNAFKLDLDNVALVAFTIQSLEVSYQSTNLPGDFNFAVAVAVGFPGGWVVHGGLTLLDGQVDRIDLGFQANGGNGIPVGDTGLFIAQIDASVQNLEHPANLVVSGTVTATYGETIALLNHPVSILVVQGSFTVDKDELVLSGCVWAGAFAGGDQLGAMNFRGGSPVELAVRLLASPQYRAAHRGPAAFVRGLYADVLGRAPTRAQALAGRAALRNGAGRAALARALLTSRASYVRTIARQSALLLGRPATPREQKLWLTRLKASRGSPARLIEALLASEEFLARAVAGPA